MARKSKLAQENLEQVAKAAEQAMINAKQAVEEAQKAEEEAIAEENQFIENIKSDIENVCKQHNVFCGVILSSQDILAIVDLAIKSKDNIKIPFQIYFLE